MRVGIVCKIEAESGLDPDSASFLFDDESLWRPSYTSPWRRSTMRARRGLYHWTRAGRPPVVFVDAPHVPMEASARDGKSGRDISLNRHHAASGSIKDGPSSREDETRGDTG